MKKLILITIFIISVTAANAQQISFSADTPKKLPKIIVKDSLIRDTVGGVVMVITREARFPGGNQAFLAFIKHHLQQTGDKGTVVVSFCVEKDGSLAEIHVVQSLSENADKEAIAVVSKSPKWKPGVQNGVRQRVHFTVPVIFGDKDYIIR